MFEHPLKPRSFVKELKSLEMLTDVLYSVAMTKLNATLQHYQRDTIVLELEHEEAPLLRKPVHLLTIGRCVILSFQIPKEPSLLDSQSGGGGHFPSSSSSVASQHHGGMFAPRPPPSSASGGGGRSIFSSHGGGGSGSGVAGGAAVAGWSSTASVRSMVSASGQSTDSEDGMERWFDTDFFKEDGGPPGEYELEPFPKSSSSAFSIYHDAEDDDAHYYSLPGTPRASPPDKSVLCL